MIPFSDQELIMNHHLKPAMMKHKSILLQCPTGWGKTFLSAWMILMAQKKGRKIIFTVPRKELLKQTSSGFSKYNIQYSYIASGMPLNPYAKVYIGMIDTMARRLALSNTGTSMRIPDCDLLIVDEGHYGDKNLDAVIKHYKNRGAWIIGLSATPWKLSGKGLGCWYDHMISGPSIKWLIDNGRLSEYKIYAPSAPDITGVGIVSGDYNKSQLAEVMERDTLLIGDAVRHYKERAMGRLNLAFCSSIKHSKLVAEYFNDSGIRAAHIDGTMDDSERRKIIRSFATRETLVLTNCEICTFGFDLSLQSGMDVTVECMSDLRPTKSLALQMQKWGRVLRKKPFPAIILDHANNQKEFGFPCDEREWSLDDRIVKKGVGGSSIPTRQCKKCYFVHRPSPKCPECGYVYEVKGREIDHVDGELIELDRNRAVDVVEESQRKKEMRKSAKDIANDILYSDNPNLAKNDLDSLNYLIAKFKKEGHKNPAAKAAHMLAARLAKKQMKE